MPFVLFSFWRYSIFLCLLGISIDMEIGKLTLDSLGKERFDFSERLHSVISRPSISPFLIKNIAQMKDVLAEIGKRCGQDDCHGGVEQAIAESKLGLERWILAHFSEGAVPYIFQVYLNIDSIPSDPVKMGLKSVLWCILYHISEGRRIRCPPWENDLAEEWLHENFPGKRALLPTPDEEACAFIASKLRLSVETMMAMFGNSPIPWMLPANR